jgi:hypothetical protein
MSVELRVGRRHWGRRAPWRSRRMDGTTSVYLDSACLSGASELLTSNT